MKMTPNKNLANQSKKPGAYLAKPSTNVVKPSKKPSSHLVKKFIVLLGVHEPKVISVQTPH